MKELDNKTIVGEGIQAVPCAFINAANPKDVKVGPWLSFNVVEIKEFGNNNGKLRLNGTRQLTYKHPDAPDYAVITVLEDFTILNNIGPNDEEYSPLFILMHAQKSVNLLVSKELST